MKFIFGNIFGLVEGFLIGMLGTMVVFGIPFNKLIEFIKSVA